ncbi:MAG: N-acetyltransferase [Mariprofundaceae bacterium]
MIHVRAAEIGDVEAIFDLLQPFADQEIILPRSRDDIYQHLQEFIVAICDDKLLGAAAVHIYGSNLAEIRSLVVNQQHHGTGLGRMLVEACEKWASGLGVACVFALTYAPDFFKRLGFSIVAKESLPHKIWTVCVHCARFTDCDEVAVQKNLSGARIKPMKLIPILESHLRNV